MARLYHVDILVNIFVLFGCQFSNLQVNSSTSLTALYIALPVIVVVVVAIATAVVLILRRKRRKGQNDAVNIETIYSERHSVQAKSNPVYNCQTNTDKMPSTYSNENKVEHGHDQRVEIYPDNLNVFSEETAANVYNTITTEKPDVAEESPGYAHIGQQIKAFEDQTYSHLKDRDIAMKEAETYSHLPLENNEKDGLDITETSDDTYNHLQPLAKGCGLKETDNQHSIYDRSNAGRHVADIVQMGEYSHSNYVVDSDLASLGTKS